MPASCVPFWPQSYLPPTSLRSTDTWGPKASPKLSYCTQLFRYVTRRDDFLDLQIRKLKCSEVRGLREGHTGGRAAAPVPGMGLPLCTPVVVGCVRVSCGFHYISSHLILGVRLVSLTRVLREVVVSLLIPWGLEVRGSWPTLDEHMGYTYTKQATSSQFYLAQIWRFI